LLVDVPTDADVALVLRHAEREPITPGTYGNDVPLTERGTHSARRLGKALSSRFSSTIIASPLPRCVQTAQAIIEGTGWNGAAVADDNLGEPGPFVAAPELAGPILLQIGPRAMAERQLTEKQPPPGMRSTEQGVELLLNLIRPHLTDRGLVSLFITHDLVLAVLVGKLYGLNVGEFDWPDYLDALIIWKQSDRLCFRWRGLHEASRPVGR
jgi:broad specificity phosphatase PhoE